eukprot:scaffold20322_cov45-Attheya_sp.AAC.1
MELCSACSQKWAVGRFPGTVGSAHTTNPVISAGWVSWSPAHWCITQLLQEVSIFTGICDLPFGALTGVGDGSAPRLILWQTVVISLPGTSQWRVRTPGLTPVAPELPPAALHTWARRRAWSMNLLGQNGWDAVHSKCSQHNLLLGRIETNNTIAHESVLGGVGTLA